MPKVSDEVLLKRAAEVHGNRYKYGPVLKNPKRPGTLFTVMCEKHGEFLQSASLHLKGSGCKKCAIALTVSKQRHTLESIKEAVKKYSFSYEYTGVEYPADNDKLRYPVVSYICQEHGEFKQNLYNHLSGKGCVKCRSAKARHTLRSAESEARKVHGDTYEYLDLEHRYVNRLGYTLPRLKIKCKKHGVFEQSYADHVTAKAGCPRCSYEKRGEACRITEEDAKAIADLDSRYPFVRVTRAEGEDYKIVVNCEKHGEFSQVSGSRLRMASCPRCGNAVSGLSKKLFDWLNSEGIPYEFEKSLTANKRIKWDLYFPESNVAVELHGVYWHSSRFKNPTDTLRKHNLALEVGVRTLHFFEDEIVNSFDLVKRHILSAIGLYRPDKVYARKAITKPVDWNKAAEFYRLNHIQGAGSPCISYGLFYEGTLVALAGFAMRASGRGNKSSTTDAELVRYATSTGVVGGLGKLIKAAQAELGFKKLVSFSEIRLHTGKTYEKLGFKLESRVKVDYMYVKDNKRVHKCGFQKSKLAKLGYKFDSTDTEKQITEGLGFYRIYDCGKLKWVKVY